MLTAVLAAIFTHSAAQTFAPEQGFVKTKASPIELAKAADRAILSLQGAEGAVQVVMALPSGRGFTKALIRVRDSKHARVDYEVLRSPSETPVFEILLLNNGKVKRIVGKQAKLVTITKDGHQVRHPVYFLPAPITEGNLPVQWPISFTALLMRGIIDRVPHVSHYVQSVVADPKDYSVWCEHRQVSSGSKVYSADRIVVERKGPALAKLGPSRIAITLDSARHLPVTVVSDFTLPGKKPSRIEWHSNWRGPIKFADKEFISPQKAQ